MIKKGKVGILVSWLRRETRFFEAPPRWWKMRRGAVRYLFAKSGHGERLTSTGKASNTKMASLKKAAELDGREAEPGNEGKLHTKDYSLWKF